MKIPNPSINRTGTSTVITLLNFEAGDSWNIYRVDGKLGKLIKIVSGKTTNSHTNSVTENGNYTYFVTMNDGSDEGNLSKPMITFGKNQTL